MIRYLGDKTLGLFTSARASSLAPLQLRFSGDLEMEAWQSDIVTGKVYHHHTDLPAITTKLVAQVDNSNKPYTVISMVICLAV